MKWFVRGLAVVGALTLVVGAAVLVASWRAAAKQRAPTVRDVAYILNWADVGNLTEIQQIECAFASKRNWLVGDQTKIYIFRVRPLPDAAFAGRDDDSETWRRGPFSESLHVRALETAALFAANTPCSQFPSLDMLNSPRFFVSFQTITAYQGQTEAVIVTAYDTRTATIHHADVRW
ncbi:MAG TPA: hypothetical protein VE010_08000 [Thermoanaerobaculia bacterium]|nr:hypothetical protein [Thermoanaerobaculia bacterium]